MTQLEDNERPLFAYGIGRPCRSEHSQSSRAFDLSTYGLQFVLGQDTGFLAVGAIFQPKQVDNLVETEAQVLRRFHERQSINIGRTIASNSAGRALGLR